MPELDPDATRALEGLLAVPDAQRDDDWRRALHAVAADAPLASQHPQLIQGPDGFGYFALQIPPAGPLAEPYTVRHVQEPCTVGGFGCVIFGRDGEPAWVFRYGEMWALRAEGRFDTRPPGDDGGSVTLEASEEVLVGAPSEDVLPDWARTVLRLALAHLDVEVPLVAVVVRPGGVPQRSLVLGPLGHVTAEERHHLTWYLPGHLGVLFDVDGRWSEQSQPL